MKKERVDGKIWHLFTYDQLKDVLGLGDAMRWQSAIESTSFLSFEKGLPGIEGGY